MNPTTRHRPGGVAAEERRAARRAFWLFLTVAVVCTAQVSWWVIFQVGVSDHVAEIQWGLLGASRDAIAARLESHYTSLWHRAFEVVHQPSWDRSIPEAITDDPAVTWAGTKPQEGVVLDAASDSGQHRSWNWVIAGPRDTLYIHLDETYPASRVARYSQSHRFIGVAPVAGPDPWPEAIHSVSILPSAAAKMEEDRRSEIMMFASEGSFFVMLIILGAYLIYRSVRQSAELRKRQHNFVAAVTHELKAPLASVKLYTETLERPDLDRQKQLQYIERSLEDVARLEELIDNILLAGRFERKGFDLRAQKTNFSEDVAEYVESLQGLLDRYGFTLYSSVEPDLWAVTDYDAMRRVLNSIVENAVKYSGDCREAKLTVWREGAYVRMSIKDCGMGIPADELEHVFDAFYRVGDEMTRKIEGTGLGLYLVREIVAAHGGKVAVESEGTGKGTTVTVTLKGTE